MKDPDEMPLHTDSWKSGESYQRYVGRWSQLVAAEFVDWLRARPGQRWLDIGCGTGALSKTILDMASPLALHGVDPSPSHVMYAREAIPDNRAAFTVGSAGNVQLPDRSFDLVVSGLVLNFIPDPAQALADMIRLTKDGGIIGAYVWDYGGKMELIRYFWDAAAALDPAVIALDEGTRFPICTPEALNELFSAAGILHAVVSPIDIRTRFENFDDYWSPFLGGQGPAPGYAMSLSDEKRIALREKIRSRLPVGPEGSISLIARAWAIKGVRP